jgi:1-acyl-sn-glycerol-3-phosphate acyltransferase
VLVSLLVRSVIFNTLFYLNLIIQMIVVLPTMAMPRGAILRVVKFWAGTNFWLLRVVCGIRMEIRGAEKIPPGALLVASKHQSVWETFALFPLFADPAFILKRELMWLPFFGWYSWKGAMIPVDRGRGGQALAALSVSVRKELARGRQVIIFPEGTRRAPGAEPSYKYGVVHLYAATGVPCLPVALNSGVLWPRRKFLRYPGTIVLEVLDPIPPGLDAQVFAQRLQHAIEGATASLIAEGR